jgi:hypothetical protein
LKLARTTITAIYVFDTSWQAFLKLEHKQYPEAAGNDLCHAIDPLIRYESYVRTIVARHVTLVQEFKGTDVALQPMLAAGGSRSLTEDEHRVLTYRGNLSSCVVLEIESFYLFSKIFLDRIAIFIEHYFGKLRNVSVHSHDKLFKNHINFMQGHDVVVPAEFGATLLDLKRRIADFRDYQIAHEQGMRTIRGATWIPGGEPRIIMAPAHPSTRKIGTIQAESEDLGLLTREIDKYIDIVQGIIVSNRHRSHLLRK